MTRAVFYSAARNRKAGGKWDWAGGKWDSAGAKRDSAGAKWDSAGLCAGVVHVPPARRRGAGEEGEGADVRPKLSETSPETSPETSQKTPFFSETFETPPNFRHLPKFSETSPVPSDTSPEVSETSPIPSDTSP